MQLKSSILKEDGPVRDGQRMGPKLIIPLVPYGTDHCFSMPLDASSVPDGTRWSRTGRTKDTTDTLVDQDIHFTIKNINIS